MASKKDFIDLITVTANSYNAAAKVEALLRAAGQPVRMQQLQPGDDLVDELKAAAPDLLICDCAGSDDPQALIRLCVQALSSTPILVLAENLSSDDQAQALKLRARDAISLRHPEHLRFTILRELSVGQGLRMLMQARTEIRNLERRVDVLMNRPQDAMVYVQDGIILDADTGFARLLGTEQPDELSGQPLLDFVRKRHRKDLKHLMSQLLKGRQKACEMDLSIYPGQGEPVDLHVHLSLAEYEGEACLEMLARVVAVEQPKAVATAEQDDAVPAASTAAAPLYQRIDAHKFPQGMAYCCIDETAAIEKRLGFLRSDALLSAVATQAASLAGAAVSSYTVGHGEFLLLGLAANDNLDTQLAQATRGIGEQLFHGKETTASVHLSVAGSQVNSLMEAAQRLVTLHEQAHSLRADGGNRAIVTGVEHDVGAAPEVQWKARLEKALRQGQITLQLRTIASLDGGLEPQYLEQTLCDAEEPVTALEFLAWVERCGLADSYQQWLLTQIQNGAHGLTAEGKAMLFLPLSTGSLKNCKTLIQWLLAQAEVLADIDLVLSLHEEAVLYAAGAIANLQTLVKNRSNLHLAATGLAGTSTSLKLLRQLNPDFVLLSSDATSALLSGKGADEDMQACLEYVQSIQGKLVAAETQDAHGMSVLWQAGINYLVTSEVHALPQGEANTVSTGA